MQRLICAFVHQLWIEVPSLCKLVHWQTYSTDLLPVLIEVAPSMELCFDFAAELVQVGPAHSLLSQRVSASLYGKVYLGRGRWLVIFGSMLIWRRRSSLSSLLRSLARPSNTSQPSHCAMLRSAYSQHRHSQQPTLHTYTRTCACTHALAHACALAYVRRGQARRIRTHVKNMRTHNIGKLAVGVKCFAACKGAAVAGTDVLCVPCISTRVSGAADRRRPRCWGRRHRQGQSSKKS